MTESVQNSPEVLCAEILADARRESEDILNRAKAEAASLLAAAEAEAKKIRRDRREQAQAEAARRRETILATVAVEAGRLRAERIELLLESVRQEIRRRLEARETDSRETVIALAAEAIRQMRGNDFLVKISAADHADFGNDLAGEILRRSGTSILPVSFGGQENLKPTGKTPVPLRVSVRADPAVADGVIIQSSDGLQIWDNRLSARLERFWPELRRQIAVCASLAGGNEAPHSFPGNIHEARQRLGVRQSSGAFTPASKAAGDCRSPKPGGGSDAPKKGNS
jgi:vacuolar-type H+-ATPase subunit E/Vma4